jgi:hypothetical protein
MGGGGEGGLCVQVAAFFISRVKISSRQYIQPESNCYTHKKIICTETVSRDFCWQIYNINIDVKTARAKGPPKFAQIKQILCRIKKPPRNEIFAFFKMSMRLFVTLIR